MPCKLLEQINSAAWPFGVFALIINSVINLSGSALLISEHPVAILLARLFPEHKERGGGRKPYLPYR